MSRSISQVIVFFVVCVLGFGGAAMGTPRKIELMVNANGIITNKIALRNKPEVVLAVTVDTIEWTITPKPDVTFQVLQLRKRNPMGGGPQNPFSAALPKTPNDSTTGQQGPPLMGAKNVAYEFTVVVLKSGSVTDVWSHNPHFFVGP